MKQSIYSISVLINLITSTYLGYIYSCSSDFWFGLTIFITYFLFLNLFCGILCLFNETSFLGLLGALIFCLANCSNTEKALTERYENLYAQNICQFLQDWDVSRKIANSHLFYKNNDKDFTEGNLSDNINYVKNDIKQYYYSLEDNNTSYEDLDKNFNKDWLLFVKWFSTHKYPQDGKPFLPRYKAES